MPEPVATMNVRTVWDTGDTARAERTGAPRTVQTPTLPEIDRTGEKPPLSIPTLPPPGRTTPEDFQGILGHLDRMHQDEGFLSKLGALFRLVQAFAARGASGAEPPKGLKSGEDWEQFLAYARGIVTMLAPLFIGIVAMLSGDVGKGLKILLGDMMQEALSQIFDAAAADLEKQAEKEEDPVKKEELLKRAENARAWKTLARDLMASVKAIIENLFKESSNTYRQPVYA